MARIEQASGRRCARERHQRFARIRTWWHNASLKTSFMGYMLVFLLLALVLSSMTASLFASLQNEAARDAHEMSGLYIYDENAGALVPARSVEVDEDGSSVFVQTVRDALTSLSLGDVSPHTSIIDASDYRYADIASDLNGSLSDSDDSGAFTIEFGSDELSAETLPVYDEQARTQFHAWVAEHPESPYASFFPEGGNNPASESASDLLTSAVGYYLSTPPSDEALFLPSLFGVLTFLMFPLWFGLCIFAAARCFFRKRLEPGFTALDDAATNIAHQDLDFAVTYDRDDELGRLAASFEMMRASLADSQRTLWRTAEERKRLNAAFAHDLRTPLTILKGKIELLDAHMQAGDASPERLTASMSSLTEQVKRLERYVEAMSGLQKLEDRTVVTRETPFNDVAGMVEDIGLAIVAQADVSAAFALSISSRCDRERPLLRIDQTLIGEVAENLIANAARYARSHIDARLDMEDGRSFVLVVEDDGPGFSPDALERGCAPFFSETPSSSHFGLGLNIASLLCEKHGGTLELENRERSAEGATGTARTAETTGARAGASVSAAGCSAADAGARAGADARVVARFSLESTSVERG